MAVEWTAQGDLFEGCNCNLLCPCHVSFKQPPTMGYCDTIWAVSIEQGRYGDVDLADLLTFNACFSGPGVARPDDAACVEVDLDADGDVDLADLVAFQANLTGSK